jgi:hypothetical protein
MVGTTPSISPLASSTASPLNVSTSGKEKREIVLLFPVFSLPLQLFIL